MCGWVVAAAGSGRGDVASKRAVERVPRVGAPIEEPAERAHRLRAPVAELALEGGERLPREWGATSLLPTNVPLRRLSRGVDGFYERRASSGRLTMPLVEPSPDRLHVPGVPMGGWSRASAGAPAPPMPTPCSTSQPPPGAPPPPGAGGDYDYGQYDDSYDVRV